jgi:hypothetical protein
MLWLIYRKATRPTTPARRPAERTVFPAEEGSPAPGWVVAGEVEAGGAPVPGTVEAVMMVVL